MSKRLVDPKDRIIFAMDESDPFKAWHDVDALEDVVGGIKFGLEFRWAMIANLLATASDQTASVYLRIYRSLYGRADNVAFEDTKLFDIPSTVGKSSLAISRLRPLMFNVHASAGSEAIAQAVKHRGDALVLGVTVLTSLKDECQSIFGDTPDKKVLQFAKMLQDQGAQGVICSPQEARLLRQAGIDLLLVCPGIRPLWAPADDQKRVMTPGEAEQEGVDHQIIGRPISERRKKPLTHVQTVRNADDTIATPRDAAEVIALEIAEARKVA